jgi:hypothetical protein
MGDLAQAAGGRVAHTKPITDLAVLFQILAKCLDVADKIRV